MDVGAIPIELTGQHGLARLGAANAVALVREEQALGVTAVRFDMRFQPQRLFGDDDGVLTALNEQDVQRAGAPGDTL